MFSDLLDRVYTKEDQQELLREIDILLGSMYKLGEESFTPTMKKYIRQTTGDLLTKFFSSTNIDKQHSLEQLKKQLLSLRELEIELGFEPSEDSIYQIHDWIAKNTDKGFVISININPNIVGGANIAYKGKFYKGSLKEKILEQIDKSK